MLIAGGLGPDSQIMASTVIMDLITLEQREVASIISLSCFPAKRWLFVLLLQVAPLPTPTYFPSMAPLGAGALLLGGTDGPG